jgi:hypothetical protein
MNQITSPAFALAINNFNPDCPVRPARTKRFSLPDLGSFLRRLRVGFDDLGVHQGLETAPRQSDNRRRNCGIHLHRRIPIQMPGGQGHFSRPPHWHCTGQDQLPQLGQPMPQIQGISHQGTRRPDGGLHSSAQFGGGELQHLRGSLATQRPSLLDAGQRFH